MLPTSYDRQTKSSYCCIQPAPSWEGWYCITLFCFNKLATTCSILNFVFKLTIYHLQLHKHACAALQWLYVQYSSRVTDTMFVCIQMWMFNPLAIPIQITVVCHWPTDDTLLLACIPPPCWKAWTLIPLPVVWGLEGTWRELASALHHLSSAAGYPHSEENRHFAPSSVACLKLREWLAAASPHWLKVGWQ